MCEWQGRSSNHTRSRIHELMNEFQCLQLPAKSSLTSSAPRLFLVTSWFVAQQHIHLCNERWSQLCEHLEETQAGSQQMQHHIKAEWYGPFMTSYPDRSEVLHQLFCVRNAEQNWTYTFTTETPRWDRDSDIIACSGTSGHCFWIWMCQTGSNLAVETGSGTVPIASCDAVHFNLSASRWSSLTLLSCCFPSSLWRRSFSQE